jgi:DNA-binding MltR family transcriptional regulator
MPKKPITEVDLNAFSERMNSESERACAILGAALLDAKLEDLFRRRLLCFQGELLNNGAGPIGSFSARIRIARALGWIDEDAQFDLDTIRSIRNEFAHSLDCGLSFSDQSISSKCGNLRTAQTFIVGFDAAASVPHSNLSAEAFHAMREVFEPPRWRYQLAVHFLAQYLAEIPGVPTGYSGPDLLQNVRASNANLRIRGSGTARAVPKPTPID